MPSPLEDIRQTASRQPRSTAFIDEVGDVTTYGELQVRVGTVLDALPDLAIAGRRVGVIASDAMQYVCLALASLEAGGAPVLLDPRWPKDVVAQATTLARCDFVLRGVGDAGAIDDFDPVRGTGDGALIMRRHGAAHQGDGVSPRTNVVIFTSGVTGPQRAILHGTEQIGLAIESIQAIASEFDPSRVPQSLFEKLVLAQADRRHLILFGVSAISGLLTTLRALGNGDAVVAFERVSPTRVVDAIENLKVTDVVLPPDLIKPIMRTTRFDRSDHESLCILGLGSAPASRQDVEELIARGEFFVVVGYGATELGGGITTTRLGDPAAVVASSVGRPYAGVELRIRADDDGWAPSQTEGEIFVRHAYGMHSCLGNEPPRQIDGFVATGDFGVIDEQDNLRILGRADGMIKRGGRRVYPERLEEELRQLDAVADACIVAGGDGGGEVALAIVPARGGPADAGEVVLQARKLLGSRLGITEVRIVGQLPRTTSGKIARSRLREVFWGSAAGVNK